MEEVTEPESAAAPAWWSRWAERARYGLLLLGLQGRGLQLVIGLVLLAWIASGIYRVQPNEQGVILRFGRLVETTDPGLHYHWPFPVEQVWLPKVTEVNQIQIGNAAPSSTDGSEDTHAGQMLTGDENIVEAAGTVLWRIKNAGDYLFNIKDTPDAVRVTAESALREIISRTPIQAAMSDQRQQIADQTTELLQRLLDKEHSGVLIVQVQLQRVDPPKEVIDAFIDVQRARADQERARNDADSYTNDILPRARGQASRILQDAQAYQAQAVNLAQGDAQGFLSVYQSYAKAKDVTAWRMYLESVDEVIKHSTKVIVDTSGKGVGSVVPYMALPSSDKPKEATK